jgi:hypothetical protein
MLSSSRARRRLAIGLAAALSCGALAVPAVASASALTVHTRTSASQTRTSVTPSFKSPTECGGDVCMVFQVTGSPAQADIIAGANGHGFTGYFHISGPDGPYSPANSPTRTWAANGLTHNSDWGFTNITASAPVPNGTYCASAIQQGGSSIGKACFTYNGA